MSQQRLGVYERVCFARHVKRNRLDLCGARLLVYLFDPSPDLGVGRIARDDDHACRVTDRAAKLEPACPAHVLALVVENEVNFAALECARLVAGDQTECASRSLA
jgi:hypothetical protein